MNRVMTLSLLLVLCFSMNHISAQTSESFDEFLTKFTTSAKYQYSRVKFPLKNPIVLLADDGETEKSFPFTKDKWALLSSDMLTEERIDQGDGSVYVAKYIVMEPTKRVFEAGFEESECDLHVEFALIDGKWYAVDCYIGWYAFDLPAEDLNEAVKHVQEENAAFKELFP